MRYPYNPRWKPSLGILVFGVALFAFGFLRARFSWFVGGFGIALSLLGGALILRRIAFPRYIDADEYSILIPSGILRAFPRRLVFGDIISIHEGASLTLRTSQQSFEIVYDLLPNEAAYSAIKEHISDRLRSSYKRLDMSGFVTYRFRNMNAGYGEIYNSSGSLVLRYSPPKSILNMFNGITRCPPFILSNPDGKEVLRIHRDGFYPLRRYSIAEGDSHVGSIRNCSLFHTKYHVHFSNNIDWSFEIPMFTVRFIGTSSAGSTIKVHLASELVWDVLFEIGQDSLPVVASLAFVHSNRCRS